jgi:hypothetical protein
MIVHVGVALGTLTLDDGSVWSWKGDHWLSGADFWIRNNLLESDGAMCARRPIPFHYNDNAPLTEAERAAIVMTEASRV